MSPEHQGLWNRIQAFDIDGTAPAALTFVTRLARENGWSRRYGEQVVNEYKRYMFLAAVSAEPICPSEDVDAAWHMHLTYTRSYWKRFCGDVLGTPIHHDPTRGGSAEAGKHLMMYERTLATYRLTFGQEPPAGIWPPAEQRFDEDLKHRVVNTTRNWIIPKAPIKKILGVTAATLTVAALIPGCNGNLNPFDLVGADFLAFLIPTMIAAICLARVIRSQLKGPDLQAGDDAVSLNWEQTAYLSGGYPRLITAAIARLVESGTAGLSDDKEQLIPKVSLPDSSFSEVERVVFSALPVGRTPDHMKRLQTAVSAVFGEQITSLEEQGFLLSSSRKAVIAFASMMPIALVILFLALPRLFMGIANNKPSEFLMVTTLFGGLIGLLLSVVGSWRLTRRGENLLVWLKSRHAGLKIGSGAEVAGSSGMSVALFGIAGLTVLGLSDLHDWFPRKSYQSGCGSGCGAGGCGGGGDGGGGCGGGGCGGCGGGGD